MGPSLRGNGFPRQCEHWLGMTARRCRVDGTSYPKGICSAALHCRTPSPTKSQRSAAKRADRCPPFTFHIIYDSAQRHDAL